MYVVCIKYCVYNYFKQLELACDNLPPREVVENF